MRTEAIAECCLCCALHFISTPHQNGRGRDSARARGVTLEPGTLARERKRERLFDRTPSPTERNSGLEKQRTWMRCSLVPATALANELGSRKACKTVDNDAKV